MLSLATKHSDPEAKLGWPERVGYGVGNLGMNMINGVLGSFLTIYFTNVALLDAGIVATLIAISKVFDGISDIIVGRLVDRTKSKLGKGRSWLLRMCIPFAVTTMLLFFVPQNFPDALKYVYVFLFYNLVNAVFYTSMLVPYYAMISLITRNPYERGMLGNIQQIFSTLGNILINSYFVVMLRRFTSDPTFENIYTQQGFTLAMLVVCIVMVILALVTVIFTKERVTGEEEKEEIEEAIAEEEKETHSKPAATTLQTVKALLTNKYWVIMALAMFVVFFVIIFQAVGGVYYCQYVFYDMDRYPLLSNSASIPQFAIMFLTPFFMKKFGKRWIYTAGMGVLAVGYLGFGLLGNNLTLMAIFNALKGCGLGMAGGMALGIVADTLTYGNLKSGIDTVGMGNAGVSAAQKIGLGLGTAVFGWILDGTDFDPLLDLQGIRQPENVTTAVQFVYTWIPLVMIAIVFVMMLLFFNLERDLKKMQAEADAK